MLRWSSTCEWALKKSKLFCIFTFKQIHLCTFQKYSKHWTATNVNMHIWIHTYFSPHYMTLYSMFLPFCLSPVFLTSLHLTVFRGKGEPVTELSWPSCRQLLYQSVATVLAHIGFESANESVLETLTDLVHEHYLRLTKLLRVAVDREACQGSTAFPDVLEQVFHELGIGSILALQRFWQVRIKDYHSYMLQVRYG